MKTEKADNRTGVGGTDDRYLFPEIADELFEAAMAEAITELTQPVDGLSDDALLAEKTALTKSGANPVRLGAVIKRLRRRA